VTFLGHVTGEAKEAFFDEIDVLAIPSEWEEPAALVGTEAAARGIPVLVSDRGGLPELPEAQVFNRVQRRIAACLRGVVVRGAGSASARCSARLISRHDEFLVGDAHGEARTPISVEAAGAATP